MGKPRAAEFPRIAPFPRGPFNLIEVAPETDFGRQLDRLERLTRLVELAFRGWCHDESEPNEEDFQLFEEFLGVINCEAWHTRSLYRKLLDPKGAPGASA